jgi:putative peptidoglycan lipid II flippase
LATSPEPPSQLTLPVLPQIAWNALTITFLSILTSAGGFLCQIVIAAQFGAGRELDAYLVVTALPLAIIAALTSAGTVVLIPIFQQLRSTRSEDAAWSLASSALWAFLGLLALLAVAGSAFSEALVHLSAPGLRGTPEEALAVRMAPFIWTTVVFTGMSALMTGLHSCCERFTLASFVMAFPTLGMLAAIALLSSRCHIMALVYGQLAGTALQAAALLPLVMKPGRLRMQCRLSDPALLRLCALAAPLLIGGSLHNALPVIDRFFASSLGVGRISQLSYSSRLAFSWSVLMSQGIATVIFPRLATAFAGNDRQGASRMLSISIRLLFAAAIPVLALSPLFARPLIELLFMRGQFTPAAAEGAASVLPLYVLAAGASALGMVIGRGFWALQDTRTPVLVNVVLYLLYIPMAYVLVRLFDYSGLAVNTAFFWCASVGINGFLLRRKLSPAGGRSVIVSMIRHLAVALAVLICVALAHHFIPASGNLIQLAIVGLGLGLYALFLTREWKHLVDAR